MLARQVFRHNLTIGSIYNAARLAHNSALPSTKDVVEVDIKMPWGKVAAKLWGDQSKQPILALHGWQDNAATFDPLAPLLLNHSAILAIDLPGHGLSSWLPPCNLYYESVYILTIRRIQKHFNWPKVKFMSHSLGAQVTTWYASLFPEDTEFVIALDHLKFPSVPVNMYNRLLADAMDKFLNIEQRQTEPPKYAEEELIKRWIDVTGESLDEAACRILMTRGMTKKPDGSYILNRDPRLKVLPVHTGFNHSYLQELAALISCPYLFLKGEDSALIEADDYINNIFNIMKKNCKEVQYKVVPGTHHFHLRHPEETAKAIIPFLEKYN